MARKFVWACALIVAAAVPASAQKAKVKGPEDGYDVLFQRYLESARQTRTDDAANISFMTDLGMDRRARHVDDLVTVRVVESISATGTADTALAKKGDGIGSVSKLFGLEGKLPSFMDPTSLVDHASDSNFKGGGTTTRSGDLTATLTARVVEVLPSGDLALEGVREIDINGDRQIVVLTGVVRPSDLLLDNSVLSSRIGQLRIRYFGRGLIKDNLKPGWLARILNKIF